MRKISKMGKGVDVFTVPRRNAKEVVRIDPDTVVLNKIDYLRLLIKTRSQLPVQKYLTAKINGRQNPEEIHSNESGCNGDIYLSEIESVEEVGGGQGLQARGGNNGRRRAWSVKDSDEGMKERSLGGGTYMGFRIPRRVGSALVTGRVKEDNRLPLKTNAATYYHVNEGRGMERLGGDPDLMNQTYSVDGVINEND
ncbi:hypothetical protein Fmac_028870 [Flemingia macrophylla]|uniref:Uncharacterized protein n=1 Tax=Flemingia macrophylla TaxID=520843 RepID=A0ABD1L8Q5_9FABA